MGNSIGAAHDPSAPAGHLPGFAREEIALLLHSPMTALAMMLRWISFEPA
jgi:hypothetical protein